ncbi:MAG: succinate dehydrogenase, cytochrome b556 subunit [Sphingomonadaceae bacterium]
MATTRTRPLSPHLSIWKWGPHMAVSIAHRVCGVGLATVGTLMFVWWLAALATGPDAYGTFLSWATWPPAWIVPIGLTLAFFLHLGNGLRHFVLDAGAGYELKTNKAGAIAVFAFAFLATGAMWLFIFARGL